MSGTLMLINPRKRRRARKSAARKSSRRRVRRASSGLFTNPVRRHRAARRRNPIMHRARRRRNPISMGGLQTTLMDAFKGAAGALTVNLAMRQFGTILPTALTTGYARYATRAGLALAIGMFGGKLIGPALARKMAEGAMTVIATDLTREVAAGQGLDLSGVGFYSPGMVAQLPMKRSLTPSLNGAGAYTRVPGSVVNMRGR